MTKLIKYKTSYIINFKDSKEYNPIEIWEQAWKLLISDLNTKDFIMINWDVYNKYLIENIKKRSEDYDLYEKKKKYWLLNYKWDDIIYKIELAERKARYNIN